MDVNQVRGKTRKNADSIPWYNATIPSSFQIVFDKN